MGGVSAFYDSAWMRFGECESISHACHLSGDMKQLDMVFCTTQVFVEVNRIASAFKLFCSTCAMGENGVRLRGFGGRGSGSGKALEQRGAWFWSWEEGLRSDVRIYRRFCWRQGVLNARLETSGMR
jgi:hypothetical protein